jgi:hypothetical protein
MTRFPLVLALLVAPAAAQVTEPDYGDGDVEVGELSCRLDGTEVGCMTEVAAGLDHCLAVDAEGEPVANSTFVSGDGRVTFQNVDPERIAALRCRPNP